MGAVRQVASPGGTRYSLFTFNLFFNYICRGLVCSSPIVTANCLRAGNNFRTFPVGADMGHVIKIDDTLPGKFASDAYCDALQRECGSTVG